MINNSKLTDMQSEEGQKTETSQCYWLIIITHIFLINIYLNNL